MFAISHAVLQSWICFVLLGIVLAVTAKRRPATDAWFPVSVTQELKGFAILLVYFSHIGNFLVSDNRFLSPLSGVSQAGVDLFLILSGYGLSVSALRRPQTIRAFYYRLVKLFVPFWMVLTLLVAGDLLLLERHYTLGTIVAGYFGIFLTSDLGRDINAPFWFITWISGCYLLFPLLFRRRRLWLSALALCLVGIVLAIIQPPVLRHIMFLYKLHYFAFPLGMTLAWFFYGDGGAHRLQVGRKVVRPLLSRVRHSPLLRPTVIIVLLLSLFVGNPHGHVVDNSVIRQLTDLSFALAVMAIFVVKRFSFGVLNMLGVYSFEIYLLHWPLISRYNLLYTHMPAWLATALYLVIVVWLARLLQLLAGRLEARLARLNG